MAEERTVEERVEEMFTADMVEPEEQPQLEVVEDAEQPTEEQPEEPAEETVEQPEDALVEFEFDGQLIEAPQNIVDALMRNDDYTQKTQAVSTERKEVELQREAVQQQAQQYEFAQSVQGDVLKAQQLEAQANQVHEYLRENIDTLSSTEIEKIRFSIEDTRRQRDELVQSVQGKTAEFQQAQEQAHVELLNKGTEVLRQKIPGWGEEHQKEVRDYLLSKGKTEAQINTIVDPVDVEIAWEAAQYRKLKDGAAPAVKKVQSAPQIKEKTRNPMPEDVKTKLNLRKKLKNPKVGSREKARLIRENMGDRWG
jgi:hypothetical protein